MKTAGLVLDFYDDQKGETLKKLCPTIDDLPETVKEAHILSPEEHGVLRDEAYALILHNNGHQLRKFACVDAGNTVLSTVYFMENFEKLPVEAIKTAAINLIAFNSEFGLPIPYNLKLAAETGMSTKTAAAKGMQRKRDSMNQPFAGDESDWAQRVNLPSVRGGEDSSKITQTANAMKTAGVDISKMRAGHKGPIHKAHDWALTNRINAKQDGHWLSKVLAEDKKHGLTADTGGHLAGFKRAFQRERGESRPLFQFPKQGNVVDVSATDPEVVITKKASEKTALRGRYSIDSYSDVNDAIDYFNDTWTAMPPEDRHEFCIKTAERAEELGIPIPELMARYGSTEYAPDVNAHLANRRAVAPEFKEVWTALEEKRASITPDAFAALLVEADESAGLNYEWGGAVADPFYATFGGKHESEKLAWAWDSGMGEQLTEDALKAIPLEQLKGSFEKDFVQAFSLNPTAIFDSMPAEHKSIIARMAQA
jgi:hypothetical protein